MNRRSFLQSILAFCAAPAIVRADSLMRVVPRETTVLVYQDVWAPARLLEASVISCPDVIEVMSLGPSTLHTLLSSSRYCAESIALELPPNADVHKLFADGRPLDLSLMPSGVTINESCTGVRTLRLNQLDLTDFGNRIPRFAFGPVVEETP